MAKYYIEFENFGGYMIENAADEHDAVAKAKAMIVEMLNNDLAHLLYSIEKQD